MEPIVIASFVAFLLVNLGLGLYQGRNVRTAPEYILGRGFTTGMLLLTLTGTLIGADYLSYLRAGSHWAGGTLFLIVISVCATSLLATVYIFPKLRRYKGWYTLGDIARQAYGSVYAQLAVDGVSLISSVILLSAQLAFLHRVTGLLGLDSLEQGSAMAKYAPYVLVVVFTLVVIAYASRAGTPGVVSTDVFQMILVLGGIAFIAYKILDLDLSDVKIQGLADLWHQVKVLEGKNAFVYMFTKEPVLPRLLIRATALGLLIFSPAFIKRVGMAADNRQLRNSMMGFVMVFVLFMLMILVSGLGLFLVHGDVVTEDNMFPILLKVIPNQGWMRVLLMVMFLALAMSTADSLLTAASVVLARIMRGLRQEQSNSSAPALSELRWNSLIVGLSALAIALLFFDESFMSIACFGRTLLGALVPCLVGIGIGIKKSSKALLAGMACFLLFFVGSIILGEVVDFSFLDPKWTDPEFSLTVKYLTLLPFTILFSCLAYLLFEVFVHGGLKWEERARFAEKKLSVWQRGWLEAKRFWISPLTWAEEKVDSYESRPVLLALFCIITFLSGHFVGKPLAEGYIKSMTVLMLMVFSVCGLLLTHEQWYRLPKRYFALFSLFSVVFCLPFAFLLRWLYHANLFNAFYLLLVPFAMHALLGGNLGMILSLAGYGLAFGVWSITFHPEVVASDRMLTLLGLGFTTLFAQIFLSYPIDRSLERAKRPKLWASAWAHDLSHLFIEAQMEVDERFNPLPKEEKVRGKEAERRLKLTSKHIQNAINQSQAFRQLIVQDSIRVSEIETLPLAKVVGEGLKVLRSDYQGMVRVTGKAAMEVRVFLPLVVDILGNLIRNAYRAGATKVELTWSEKGPVLYIKDNGPGISQDKLASLFEMKSSRDGKGIGLPFIKEALAKMGALIDVESGSGGSVFMILLDRG